MMVSRRAAWVMLLATSAGALLLLLAVPNLGPAVRAARGDGVAGTFVATQLRCVQHPGHELCTWYGTFRPDGSRTDRAGVHLYGAGRGTLRTGQAVPAIDAGRATRVYPPTGSGEWIPTLGLTLAGCALFVPLLRESVRVVRAFRQPFEDDGPADTSEPAEPVVGVDPPQGRP
jgi:hypothetical protein